MMTGNFTKAIEGRMSKNLKVPSSKARELYRSMVLHGNKRQQEARKEGKANS